MAEDDIYGSKRKYERFKATFEEFSLEPDQRPSKSRGAAKYTCKNPENLKYFRKLFSHFEAKDLSYIRRNRLLQSMRLICHFCEKDLAHCSRDDVNEIMAAAHQICKTPKSKETFIWDIKHFWRLLFPETDEKGRADESIVPYPVRHLSAKTDKSRQRLRKDKLTWVQFEELVNYFGGDPRIQCFLTLAAESIGRPQELLYLKISDLELHDSYAKISISEHGKEGVGLLQCIDSYPYLLKWLDVHPLRKNPKAFLFVNTGWTNTCKQLKPANINKFIHKACKNLGIEKPITCYSLKRNGVTLKRLRGDSDMAIQHAARWTSTKQLKTYDMSTQDDALNCELEKRGLISSNDSKIFSTQSCAFCQKVAGFGETVCQQCRRPLDRNAVKEEARSNTQEVESVRKEIAQLTEQINSVRALIIPQLAREILEKKADSLSLQDIRRNALRA